MKFRLAKSLLIITLILSILQLLIILEVLTLPANYHFTLIYSLFSILTLSVAYLSLLLAAKQKPKEVVKVVYKEVAPKESKPKEDKELKEKQIIQKYVDIVTKDLKEFVDSYEDYATQLFQNLANAFEIVAGMFFLWSEEKQAFYSVENYAFYDEDNYREYKLGEGITGQVGKDKRILYIDNVPEGYIKVLSGLGEGTPRYLVLLPIVKKDKTLAIVEFATFNPLPEPTMKILEAISKALQEIIPINE